MYPATKSSRLGSWKEIAAYLGRDVRTVIRWEKERGLPVYRDGFRPGRPTVYAETEELDRWLIGHEGEQTELVEFDPAPRREPTKASPNFRTLAIVVLGALLIGLILSLVLIRWTAHRVQFSRVDFPAAAPMSVAIADFDRDGNLDIVFTNAASDTVDILFGDGKGAFPRRTSISSAREPERLAVADFNKDGIPDLVVTHRGSHDVTVLLGDGRGSFRQSFTWNAGGRSRWVTAEDVNLDGIPDLVLACSSTQKIAVMLGRGDGTFDNIRQYDTDGEPSAVIVGDFNRDKIPDLITADYQISGGKTISLYTGVGDGTFRPRRAFATGFGPLGITSGDFNRDGLLDIATADFRDDVSVLLANAEGFSAPRIYTAHSAPGFISTGDFDGDGNLDLIMVAEHSNNAHLYFGNGRGSFSTPQILETGNYPDAIAVADLNRDGRLDFVVAATYGNLISVYLNRHTR